MDRAANMEHRGLLARNSRAQMQKRVPDCLFIVSKFQRIYQQSNNNSKLIFIYFFKWKKNDWSALNIVNLRVSNHLWATFISKIYFHIETWNKLNRVWKRSFLYARANNFLFRSYVLKKKAPFMELTLDTCRADRPDLDRDITVPSEPGGRAHPAAWPGRFVCALMLLGLYRSALCLLMKRTRQVFDTRTQMWERHRARDSGVEL